MVQSAKSPVQAQEPMKQFRVPLSSHRIGADEAIQMTADTSQTRIWEGWRSDFACLLVAVESDSWCADPTALWTGEGLGWGWLVGCSLFLSPASFLCSFMPPCLKFAVGFSHWWAPTVSVWGFLLPWLMADSHLLKLSLQLVFVMLKWSTMITFSF